MAQHKAATAVTIAPTSEKSALATWVERYWLVATAAVLVLVAFVVYRHMAQEKVEVASDESWSKLLAAVKPDADEAEASGKAKQLQELGESLKGQQAGPWAFYLAATNALDKAEFDVAASSLARLRESYPQHPLVCEALGAEALAPVARLERQLEAEKSWRAAHPGLYANPPPPSDSPRVRIQTSKGPIVIALYPNLAPKHVENFLKLTQEKFYDGTKFHRVKANQFIQGGDPNSKNDDVATWGQGGPGYKVAREETGLRHFAGAVAAAKMGADAESSGSQFYVCTTPQHAFDGDYVVFGVVVEGLANAKAIDQGAVVKGTDRPEEPVAITAMEVVSG